MFEVAKKLHLAAHRNDYATLAQLLKSASSADVNYQLDHPTEKTSHLIIAIQRRNVESAKMLLTFPSINVNLKNGPGMTALHMAAQEGFPDIVVNLLSLGADPNAKNFTGMTPLVYAAQKGNIDSVRALLSDSRLQDVNARDDDLKITALMRACDRGHADIVQLLLAHPRIDVNLQNFKGYTALVFAAMNSGGTKEGHIECVKMLLSDARVDVNIKTKDGHPAVAYGYDYAIKSLLSGKRVIGSYPAPVAAPPPVVKTGTASIVQGSASPLVLPPAAPFVAASISVAPSPPSPRVPADATKSASLSDLVAPKLESARTEKTVRDDTSREAAVGFNNANKDHNSKSSTDPLDDPCMDPEDLTQACDAASQQLSTRTSLKCDISSIASGVNDSVDRTTVNAESAAVSAVFALPSANSDYNNTTAAASIITTTSPASSWLAAILLNEGYAVDIVNDCEQRLVVTEGFVRELDFASLDAVDFNRAYLKSVGITGLGIQTRLMALQKELYVKHAQVDKKTRVSGASIDGKFSVVQAQLEELGMKSEVQRQLEDSGALDPVYCE